MADRGLRRSHQDGGARASVAQEVDDRSEPGVAVLGANGPGVDQHGIGRAQGDGLVEPGRVVVEEGDRTREPIVKRSGQVVVAGQAVEDGLGHRVRAYTAPAVQ